MADGMLSLSWNNHSSTFSHTLATLRAKERYTDVTIACCGKFYPVHKLVLSTCSEYFETMFEQTPCKHPVIVLRDIQCDELEALLNYMYAGVVSVAQSDLARLIKVAELLQIKGLAVPDEPPKSNKSFSHSDKANSHPRTRQYNSLSSEKSSPHTRSRHSHSSSDDRLSPNAKRRRLDNNSSDLMEAPSLSNSPGVPNVSSPQKDSERHANRSGTWSDHQEGSTEGHREEEGEYQSNSQDPLMSPEEVNVDESLVKEEVVEDAGDQNDLSESGVDYDEYAGESTGGADGQDNMGLLLPKYDDTPSNQQSASHSAVDQHAALPDAVIEALAGPSGMQGWPGGGELTRRLGENFGEMNQDLSPGSLGQAGSQAHQVVRLARRGTRSGWFEAPVVSLGLDTREETFHPILPSQTTVDSDTMKQSCSLISAKPYTCPYCPFRASHRSKVQIHLRTHTGEKPFSCHFCSSSFAKKGNLKTHIRIHTGEKPYACLYCHYRCAHKSDLKKHIVVHTR